MDSFFDPGLGLGPVCCSKDGQLGLFISDASVFADLVQLGGKAIECRALGIVYLQIVLHHMIHFCLL